VLRWCLFEGRGSENATSQQKNGMGGKPVLTNIVPARASHKNDLMWQTAALHYTTRLLTASQLSSQHQIPWHFKILQSAFSALTLLVGQQEGHPACRNWVVRYWHGYLSEVRCKWFAYGPADATATPSSLASVKSRMVYVSSASLPRLSWKKGR